MRREEEYTEGSQKCVAHAISPKPEWAGDHPLWMPRGGIYQVALAMPSRLGLRRAELCFLHTFRLCGMQDRGENKIIVVLISNV